MGSGGCAKEKEEEKGGYWRRRLGKGKKGQGMRCEEVGKMGRRVCRIEMKSKIWRIERKG